MPYKSYSKTVGPGDESLSSLPSEPNPAGALELGVAFLNTVFRQVNPSINIRQSSRT